MVELLKEEMETYEARKRDLVTNSIGKFVLIKDNQVVDVFEAQGDAIRQGYERFGNVPFLVKQIVEVETPQHFTSNLLGI